MVNQPISDSVTHHEHILRKLEKMLHEVINNQRDVDLISIEPYSDYDNIECEDDNDERVTFSDYDFETWDKYFTLG